ncbi:flagellar hook-associated protein 1 [Paenibacillus cisolokensis]|uniref:Flagellar hook-associated protein 1 n=1 Tax=Paenibacillus cisolokensis TaxID=1658519 RepID=A0ABQ4N3U6_9BACL|nr:flagellar hook-associated protein FlgK [Paenibacillus cisolokensis]GIQ62840.1 flagellar hook-associated protein 1 [Paenibacillus cisolokensis]
MRSTFMGLETSKRALLTQSTSLHTLGHNIANASTTGYTRQRVNVAATRPIEAFGMMRSNAPGQIGTGVQPVNIERIRDSYIDMQYRRENQRLGAWEVYDATLQSIEKIVNEPTDSGLSAVMGKFWNSLEVLNRDPSLLSARIDLIGTAVNLVETFKHMDTSFKTLASDIAANIDKKVAEANGYIANIAQLNDTIRRMEALGDNANDYRDQRDLLIDKLTSIVDVQYAETADGMVNIVAAGVQVVNGTEAAELTADNAATATEGALAGYRWAQADVAKVVDQLNAMVDTLVNGKVEITLANGYVASTDMTALNDVTLEDGTVIPAGQNIPAGSRIASEVRLEVNGFNGVHKLGYTLSDPAESGIAFFTTSDGSATFTMENIRVNPVVANDTSKIAAAGKYDVVNGSPVTIKGNSDIALVLAGLRDKVFEYPADMTSLTSGTIDDYFRAFTGDLGTRASDAARNLHNQLNMVDAVEYRRQSVSGVSLDEELADMIRFQHAYNAAARNMTTVDEMLDRIINQMGLVGR